MTGLQLDIEFLCDAAQHTPNYAPWDTTLGTAIEAAIAGQASGKLFLSEKQLNDIRPRLAVHEFRRDMTLSGARAHAKALSLPSVSREQRAPAIEGFAR
jgi:hypothetical protein